MSTIRPLVLGVFRRGSQILVGRATDPVKEEAFFRPVGGEIEFGELAVDALRREMREELRAEITEPERLGVLENVFTYDGRPGHEIVVVFRARFVDPSFYELDEIPIFEDVWEGRATWLDLREPIDAPLYPEGLLELLVERGETDG